MLTDDIGFILRNDVIWNKMKGGPDNSKDKFRNIHEHFFLLIVLNKTLAQLIGLNDPTFTAQPPEVLFQLVERTTEEVMVSINSFYLGPIDAKFLQ